VKSIVSLYGRLHKKPPNFWGFCRGKSETFQIRKFGSVSLDLEQHKVGHRLHHFFTSLQTTMASTKPSLYGGVKSYPRERLNETLDPLTDVETLRSELTATSEKLAEARLALELKDIELEKKNLGILLRQGLAETYEKLYKMADKDLRKEISLHEEVLYSKILI